MSPTSGRPAVLLDGYGALVDVPLRGRPLRAHALDTLQAAGCEVLPSSTPWDELRRAGVPVVVHDPLCPLTPPAFIEQLIAGAADEILVGVRPVTDTVKLVIDRFVGETVDRESLVAIAAPVVLPPSPLVELGALPADLTMLVRLLRDAGRAVRFIEAPLQARRVADESDVALLEQMVSRASE